MIFFLLQEEKQTQGGSEVEVQYIRTEQWNGRDEDVVYIKTEYYAFSLIYYIIHSYKCLLFNFFSSIMIIHLCFFTKVME